MKLTTRRQRKNHQNNLKRGRSLRVASYVFFFNYFLFIDYFDLFDRLVVGRGSLLAGGMAGGMGC